jgi:hypothetical protein
MLTLQATKVIPKISSRKIIKPKKKTVLWKKIIIVLEKILLVIQNYNYKIIIIENKHKKILKI